ncbi:hypothetical protein ABBQ38_008518 [Trebouxia sp. C0009 RCD-2024]
MSLTGSLPATWGQQGAFPALQDLQLGNSSQNGSLPPEWAGPAAFRQLSSLLLFSIGISGTLPLSWANNGSLPALLELGLVNTNLTGTLPSAWASPAGFQQLQSLTVINASITGVLPTSWSDAEAFPSLQYLDLEGLSLSGSLPTEYGSSSAFRRLETLTIHNCTVTGTLPTVWGAAAAFPVLTGLDLQDCPLNGSLPESWGSSGGFPNLTSLSLGAVDPNKSQLTGILPASWGSPGVFSQLQTLVIQQDSFSMLQAITMMDIPVHGALPVEWGSLGGFQQLREMTLANIRLTVMLPSSWGKSDAFPQLQNLNVNTDQTDSSSSTASNSSSSSRSLCPSGTSQAIQPGAMPCGHWPNLLQLSLSSCNLKGSFPANFTESFPELQKLDVNNNQLTGLLPPTLPPRLWWLDLGSNSLSGSLPNAWSGQNLYFLFVGHNNLTGPIPPAWGEPDAMPSVALFYVAGNKLTGTLPKLPPLTILIASGNLLTGTIPSAGWPSYLWYMVVDDNQLNGSIPAELASLQHLQVLTMTNNRLTGNLPEAWSAPSTFPELYSLQLDGNALTGTLPSCWGDSSAFPQLEYLSLGNCGISGTLPESWASKTAFPRLRTLDLVNTTLSGTLPLIWSSHDAFPHLEVLFVGDTGLNGSVPAFNNRKLSFVDLSACHFTSDLGVFWNSSAPLTGASLSYNRLSGSLPNTPPSLGSLTFLDTSNNSIQGTLPLSWLTKDSFLSHVSYLDVGQVWQRSLSMLSWRQQLCLHQDFYSPDVTGVQLARLPALLQSLGGQEIGAAKNLSIVQTGEVADVLARFLLGTVQKGGNQLTAVPTICANNGAGKVLLILWVLFGGCCLIIVCLYACLCRLAAQLAPLSKSPWLQRLPARFLVGLCRQTFQGLGGLAFYYYDLITAIVVLAQVWGTWPGDVLTAICFFHFAITGAIVAVHAAFRLKAMYNVKLQSRNAGNGLVMLGSLIVGPIFIPVVLVLDTIVFVRQVALCIQGLAKSPGLQWLRPCYVSIFRVNRCVVNSNFAAFTWIDLESYESMHNVIAAVFQSLPTKFGKHTRKAEVKE